MSSTYTGVPANIGAVTPVTLVVPADGDARNAASVNVAHQKTADYIAYLETQLAPLALPFTHKVFTGAGGPFFCYPSGYVEPASLLTGATMPSTADAGRGGIILPFAGKCRGLVVQLGNQGPVGGSLTFTVYHGGATGMTTTFAAGAAAFAIQSDVVAGHQFTFNASDIIAVQVTAGAGITNSGPSYISLLCALN